jgi:hypothetical protein
MLSSNKSTREEGAAAEKTAMSSRRHARATRPVATLFMSKSKIEKGFAANSSNYFVYNYLFYQQTKKIFLVRELSTATFCVARVCGGGVW